MIEPDARTEDGLIRFEAVGELSNFQGSASLTQILRSVLGLVASLAAWTFLASAFCPANVVEIATPQRAPETTGVPNFTLVDAQIFKEPTGQQVFCGDLNNTTNVTYDLVEIKISLFDAAGKKLDDTWAICRWVGPHKQTPFQTNVGKETARISVEEISGC